MLLYNIDYTDTEKCLAQKLDTSNLPNITSYLTNNKFTVCRDDGATPPWLVNNDSDGYYIRFMNLIRDKMRTLYDNADINYDWHIVDVSEEWFEALKRAVDTDKCAFLISTATVTPDRASQVTYSCRFASVKDAYLRGELDSNLLIGELKDLNSPSFKICVQKGTTYSELASKDFSRAQIVEVGGQTDCYPKIVDREVHVVFCDQFCLQTWLDENEANCETCKVVPFGEAGQFAPMFTNSVATMGPSVFLMLVAVVCSLFFF